MILQRGSVRQDSILLFILKGLEGVPRMSYAYLVAFLYMIENKFREEFDYPLTTFQFATGRPISCEDVKILLSTLIKEGRVRHRLEGVTDIIRYIYIPLESPQEDMDDHEIEFLQKCIDRYAPQGWSAINFFLKEDEGYLKAKNRENGREDDSEFTQ